MKSAPPFAACVKYAAHLMLLAGCHNVPCYELGYDEGERFQITVLAVDPGGLCQTPLKLGESFTIVAGPEVVDDCHVRAASPAMPPFAADILMSCQPRAQQLGLTCMGVTPSGCAVSLAMNIGPYIARGVNVIEQGLLSTTWSGSICEPRACSAVYDVRIERLGP